MNNEHDKPLCKSEELYQVEDYWKEEKGEGVAKPGLCAEAVLEAVDGAPGGVESWALEDLLALLALLYALVDVGDVVVLVVILDGQQGVKEYVHHRGAYGGTEPGHEESQPDLGSPGERVRVLEVVELHDDLTGGHGGLQLASEALLRLEDVSPVASVLLLQDYREGLRQINPE